MASADITRLLNSVRVHVPGALDPAIRQELFSAVDEFLQKSSAWQEHVSFHVKSGKQTYSIAPKASGAKIIRLVRVHNSSHLSVWATMGHLDVVHLRFAPTEDDTYTAQVVLSTADPTDSDGDPYIPSSLLQKYREGLFDGVVGRLMMQPMKPYTNTQLATYHLRRFGMAASQARSDAQRKQLHGAQAWNFPGGWGRRQGGFW